MLIGVACWCMLGVSQTTLNIVIYVVASASPKSQQDHFRYRKKIWSWSSFHMTYKQGNKLREPITQLEEQ